MTRPPRPNGSAFVGDQAPIEAPGPQVPSHDSAPARVALAGLRGAIAAMAMSGCAPSPELGWSRSLRRRRSSDSASFAVGGSSQATAGDDRARPLGLRCRRGCSVRDAAGDGAAASLGGTDVRAVDMGGVRSGARAGARADAGKKPRMAERAALAADISSTAWCSRDRRASGVDRWRRPPRACSMRVRVRGPCRASAFARSSFASPRSSR